MGRGAVEVAEQLVGPVDEVHLHDSPSLSSTRRAGCTVTGPFQKGLLGLVGRQRAGSVVLGSGFGAPPQPAQEVGPDRVEEVVRLEGQAFEGGQPGLGSLDFGDGDSAIEGDDRRPVENEQLVVEGEDLAPIRLRRARRVAVDGVDGGLQLVGARGLPPQAGLHELLTLDDLYGIPQGAILLSERDQRAIGADRARTDARRSAA